MKLMKQNELLRSIVKLIPDEQSLFDVISSVLDISYASAYRRTTNSAKLSIDEAVKLAKHFNLSLDMIFSVGDKNIIPIQKTEIVENTKGVEDYFKNLADMTKSLSELKGHSVIYCAKDLPLHHCSEGDNLIKLNIFVWFKLLNPSFKDKNFEDFKLSHKIKNEYLRLRKYFHKLNITEIWDVTTINSTLKQILYYTSTNHLKIEEALMLCDELKESILNIREEATPESNFKLYCNELLSVGNKMLIKTPFYSSLYIQYTALNYFNTIDKNTCDHTLKYLDRVLEDCKLINISTEKEKNLFFSKMLNKITSLKEHLLSKPVLDF